MSRSPVLSHWIAPLVLALAVGTGSVGYGQTSDIDAMRAAAENGDANAQLQLGEALLFGTMGVPEDRGTALELITAAAEGGSVDAKARLGTILVDGFYTDADPERGVALLEDAARAGDASAIETLGTVYLWGQGVDADPARARELLSQAAQNGSIDAKRILGEQLVGGWVLEQDVDAGLGLLEEAVAEGDAKSEVALGKILLYGQGVRKDKSRARTLFEAAAEKGNGEGLLNLGSDLMWSRANPRAAREYLTRSGELGTSEAWTTLAEGAMYGYFGHKQRRSFDQYAEKAIAAGETRIAVLDAQRQLYGISMRASGPKAIAGLEEAADEGNADAARFLVRLVRNGNGLNVRKRTDAAAEYLDEYGDLFSAEERERLEFTVKVAGNRMTSAYDGFAEDFDARPDLKTPDFGADIFASNPNFAIHYLQTRFNESGTHVGPEDGLIGTRTLRALRKACNAELKIDQCDIDVVVPGVIGQLLTN